MEILAAALRQPQRLALRVGGLSYSFQDLLHGACGIARQLEGMLPERAGRWGPRVGLYLRPSAAYVASTWGTWIAGGIAVPLCISHTQSELRYVINDATMSLILTDDSSKANLQSVADVRVETVSEIGPGEASLDSVRLPSEEDGALILYTSGTTGKPKGALHTHRSLNAQMDSLSKAWGWSEHDVLLHALPLHHIHGIVNALHTAHYNGACVHLLPKFSPSQIWTAFSEGGISLFMGVPTMYSHLLSYWERLPPEDQVQLQKAARLLRLYVSGSAACPVSVMKKWRDVSGHWLLERYGMTEIGMALSNPLNGERRPGSVGVPLPGVSVKVVPDSEPSGELCVKGDAVFSEYWCNRKATSEAFDSDGFFKTGDIVTIDGSPSYFKILGRNSVDIIKSGGFKLSALEIENAVLEHPLVKECSVIGIPNEPIQESDLKEFCTEHLAPYKIPRWIVFMEEIPRNSMGKVNKKQLAELVVNM